MSEQTQRQYRTPLFKAVRRIVDAVEDVIDDTVDRGQGVERDTRRLVDNLFREREDDEQDSSEGKPRRSKREATAAQ